MCTSASSPKVSTHSPTACTFMSSPGHGPTRARSRNEVLAFGYFMFELNHHLCLESTSMRLWSSCSCDNLRIDLDTLPLDFASAIAFLIWRLVYCWWNTTSASFMGGILLCSSTSISLTAAMNDGGSFDRNCSKCVAQLRGIIVENSSRTARTTMYNCHCLPWRICKCTQSCSLFMGRHKPAWCWLNAPPL